MLEDQINKDYIQAMKDRNTAKKDALNFLRAQLKNIHIDKKVDKLDDLDVITVLKKQVKQRQDSITQYTDGGRVDLAEKEKFELEILQQYLPAELSDEKITVFVQEAIKETGAASMKDMGSVMKAVGAKTAGQADNKKVSELVKDALSKL